MHGCVRRAVRACARLKSLSSSGNRMAQQAQSLSDLVGTKLRRGTAEVDTAAETQGKLIGFYFSAHWVSI